MKIQPYLTAKVEGWNVGETQIKAIEVPEALEDEIRNAFTSLDKIDAEPNDGTLDIVATAKIPLKGSLRLLHPITGATLDIQIDLDIALDEENQEDQ